MLRAWKWTLFPCWAAARPTPKSASYQTGWRTGPKRDRASPRSPSSVLETSPKAWPCGCSAAAFTWWWGADSPRERRVVPTRGRRDPSRGRSGEGQHRVPGHSPRALFLPLGHQTPAGWKNTGGCQQQQTAQPVSRIKCWIPGLPIPRIHCGQRLQCDLVLGHAVRPQRLQSTGTLYKIQCTSIATRLRKV